MFSFFEMELRFGAAGAYQCLTEIEKAAHIASWQLAEVDPEIRLINALQAQDSAVFAFASMAG